MNTINQDVTESNMKNRATTIVYSQLKGVFPAPHEVRRAQVAVDIVDELSKRFFLLPKPVKGNS